MQESRVFFGGPDRSPGYLGEILAERIAAVPAGGEILWSTYYFRSKRLAESLVAAFRRGVRVTLCLEAKPRQRQANDEVIGLFERAGGLGGGFRAVSELFPAHLHEKIYFFSHPSPVALVGSFNPSDDRSESDDDAALIGEIGDQDHGHNCLVEIHEPTIVESLRRHVGQLREARQSVLHRFEPAANAVIESGPIKLGFFPRRSSAIFLDCLRAPGLHRIRIAASHFRDPSAARILARQVAAGGKVEVIAHDTVRRFPVAVENVCRRAGMDVRRYRHPLGYPMHCKFILLEGADMRRSVFGSMNLTRTSRWLNHEVLVQSDEPSVFSQFERRWQEIGMEMQGFERSA
jgi:phosphatidylserine/phosphatidylglycerophosphate/cardiolipin synthase-like enzyme